MSLAGFPAQRCCSASQSHMDILLMQIFSQSSKFTTEQVNSTADKSFYWETDPNFCKKGRRILIRLFWNPPSRYIDKFFPVRGQQYIPHSSGKQEKNEYMNYNTYIKSNTSGVSAFRAFLHGVGDPGLVGLVSFVFTLWGTHHLPH